MLNQWISEARPRTLVLASGNCIVGAALGFYYGAVNLYTLTLALLIVITASFLQILSNFANDYGDAISGADAVGRLGPMRSIMEGGITLNQLRRGMAVVILCAAFTGFIAVCMAFGNNLDAIALFLFLGVISIVAALLYTIGLAYGYKGLGDIAVFIFFGPLSVICQQIMITADSGGGTDIYPDTIALSVSIGLESVMVLHINNMRDMATDRINGKHTLAVRLGARLSAIYHAILFGIVVLTSFAACYMSHKGTEIAILAITLIPLMASTVRIVRNVSDARLVAAEFKFTILGITLHTLGWIIVLTVDFWYYYA